jgi:chemosensory pili system protein ChpA (sensor histidine kinase/response regulator)
MALADLGEFGIAAEIAAQAEPESNIVEPATADLGEFDVSTAPAAAIEVGATLPADADVAMFDSADVAAVLDDGAETSVAESVSAVAEPTEFAVADLGELEEVFDESVPQTTGVHRDEVVAALEDRSDGSVDLDALRDLPKPADEDAFETERFDLLMPVSTSANPDTLSDEASEPVAEVEVLDLPEMVTDVAAESVAQAELDALFEDLPAENPPETGPELQLSDAPASDDALAGAVDDLDAFLASIGVPDEAMDVTPIEDFDAVASVPETSLAGAFAEFDLAIGHHGNVTSDDIEAAPAEAALPVEATRAPELVAESIVETAVEADSALPAEAEAEIVEVKPAPVEFVSELTIDAEADQVAAPTDATRVDEASSDATVLEAMAAPIVEIDTASPVEAVVESIDEPQTETAISAPAAPEAAVPAAAAVPQLATAIDTDPPGELDLPDLDRDLLEIFVQEGGDIIDAADNLMVRLREQPEDRDTIVALQRELHTLKGSARMTGLAPIGDLTHAMESLFEAVADGRARSPRDSLEYLERSFDRLSTMVQRVARNQQIATPGHIIHQLELLTQGLDPRPVAAPATEAAAPAVAVIGETAAPVTAPVAVAAPVPAPAPRADAPRRIEDDEARPQQEMIRVRADLIDNLVNFAGEVSIYRSRLEAQIGGFRFNLQEFDVTTLRLREQLRKLEMETEAQILSRFQRETHEDRTRTDFDPLELDRFSTLQQLSRALAESVSDLISLQNLMDDIARQSETLLLQQSRVSSELQEGLMRTRMVPFESVVPRLRRIVRQTAAELGKKAQLKVEGAQGEMDRTVLERMTAPLEHMLRNALAHGLERPDQRVANGKPEEGTILINVAREGTEVVIRVSDDGAGMNRDAIRARAIERGLLRPEVQLSDRDLFQFIMEPGFSTAAEVSKVAGRGVGMDVVHNEVKMLGGNLQIDSTRGRGSLFTVRLPFTLAITQAVMIKLADHLYAVPMSSVSGVMRMQRREFDRRLEQNQLEVTYAGENFQIYDLGDLLATPIKHPPEETQVPLLMTKTGDQRAAIRVSHVIGGKEIVVKSVGPQLSAVPGFFGATIMGDGSVVVILDLAPLVRHGLAVRQAPELAAELDLLPKAPEPEVARNPLVMVVDDSITMRKVTTRVLERHNLEVITAKDGLDAVEQLQDRIPDVVLLDIEMPRMDGYELATYIRNDPRLKHLPLIMITSRTGDKHRQRALEIGVDRYLGKPYQEADLVKNVQESLAHGRSTIRQ